MKENSIVAGLNKAFTNEVRIGIMAVLVVNEWVDFNSLKELIGASDGNLASHLKALENKDYIQHKKEFIGRKPRTSYQVTQKGKDDFDKHLSALENLINSQRLALKK